MNSSGQSKDRVYQRRNVTEEAVGGDAAIILSRDRISVVVGN